MSFLSMYLSQLQRERGELVRDQGAVASASEKITRKQGELARASTASRRESLQRDLLRLGQDHARASRAVADRQRKVSDLEKRVADEQRREGEREQRRLRQAEQEQRASRLKLERTLASTTTSVQDLRTRVSDLEETLLVEVKGAVAADPVQREHDVFLSHAGPDRELAGDLHQELIARDLDVWFDGAELRLGESLTRQIDRGIARCRIGVLLVTPSFLEGRYWTEREMGGLISSRRRVIPVLDRVTFSDLASYSPLLADLVGLSIESAGLGEIADQIKGTVQPNDSGRS